MAGLTSDTFEYLQGHAPDLMLNDDNLKLVTVARTNSVQFYSSCAALSRPCALPGMAKVWPAYRTWTYASDGYDHLDKIMGKLPVTAFEI